MTASNPRHPARTLVGPPPAINVNLAAFKDVGAGVTARKHPPVAVPVGLLPCRARMAMQ